MNNPDWFGAKTIYKHNRVEGGETKAVFEERVNSPSTCDGRITFSQGLLVASFRF